MRNELILLSVVLIASGCLSNNNPKTQLEQKIQETSLEYSPNSIVQQVDNSTLETSVVYRFTVKENDSSYSLNPGIKVKIFDSDGRELKSRRLAKEGNHRILIRNFEASLEEERNLTACFAYKGFRNSDGWGIEERDSKNVFCRDDTLENPIIKAEVNPKVVEVYQNDASKNIEIKNTGNVGLEIFPRFGSEEPSSVIDYRGRLQVYAGNGERSARLAPNETEILTVAYFEDASQSQLQTVKRNLSILISESSNPIELQKINLKIN